MSGYQAWISWANHIKAAMAGKGITVYLFGEIPESPSFPYLLLQDGPERIRQEWLSSLLCQAWLVVRRQDNEDLMVTLGKATDTVMDALRDPGSLPKYDYSQSPKVQTGLYLPQVQEITGPKPGKDSNRLGRVITWTLKSNAAG